MKEPSMRSMTNDSCLPCSISGWRRAALLFTDRQRAINYLNLNNLTSAARPPNLQLIHLRSLAQAEVQSQVRLRAVARAADVAGALAFAAGRQPDCRADRVARAFRSADQFQRQPMAGLLRHIAQDCRRVVAIIEYDVHAPVVVVIEERRAARRRFEDVAFVGRARDVAEFLQPGAGGHVGEVDG